MFPPGETVCHVIIGLDDYYCKRPVLIPLLRRHSPYVNHFVSDYYCIRLVLIPLLRRLSPWLGVFGCFAVQIVIV